MVKELPHRTKTIRQINGFHSDTHILTHGVRNGRSSDPRYFRSSQTISQISLHSAETYLYADDIAIYCIAEKMDLLTNTLNNVLAELQKWCNRNLMVAHPEKCKAMIMERKSTLFTGPIQAVRLGKVETSERVREIKVDNKLSWSDHAANVAKSFASKSSLLRRMRFLPRKQLLCIGLPV